MRISIPTLPISLSPFVSTSVRNLAPPTQLEIAAAAERIATFLEQSNALVITGAGVSVDSGIRAYRGGDGRYSNPNFKPIFYQELTDPSPKGFAFRQRYWSRSYLGYPPVRDAQPNPTHFAISALQYLNHAPHLITQNVDGLHHKSSPFSLSETQERILELHGTLHAVHCSKGHRVDRNKFQDMLSRENPSWAAFADEVERTGQQLRTNPDGDVDLGGRTFDDFVVPNCEECQHEGHGEPTIFKPDLIFFGESLSPEVRVRSFQMVEEADRILLVGTTLATFSAFRLVKLAVDRRKPVMMLNLGPARTDILPEVEKIEMPSREVLLGACRLLAGEALTQSDETLKVLLSSGIIKTPDGPEDEVAAAPVSK